MVDHTDRTHPNPGQHCNRPEGPDRTSGLSAVRRKREKASRKGQSRHDAGHLSDSRPCAPLHGGPGTCSGTPRNPSSILAVG